MAQPKLRAMIGMFHDEGNKTRLWNNVAAGSERAGFSGAGQDCADSWLFQGNEALSCLAGYWFDAAGIGKQRELGRTCNILPGFKTWKIFEYSVYGEVPYMPRFEITGLRSADARVGMLVIMGGAGALSHTLADQRVFLTDSLMVGHSDNGNCEDKSPGLYTCDFFMAYCDHLGPNVRASFPATVP